MKVRCTMNGSWYDINDEEVKGPECGDLCNVVGEYFCNILKMPCYILEEWPRPVEDPGYSKDGFSPLSDIDEVALFNERFKELQTESV